MLKSFPVSQCFPDPSFPSSTSASPHPALGPCPLGTRSEVTLVLAEVLSAIALTGPASHPPSSCLGRLVYPRLPTTPAAAEAFSCLITLGSDLWSRTPRPGTGHRHCRTTLHSAAPTPSTGPSSVLGCWTCTCAPQLPSQSQ